MIYDSKTIQKVAAYLQIRFPVAEFSRELNYSKSAISNYLNGNKPISQSFVDAIEKTYKIKVADFISKKSATVAPALKMDNIKAIAVFVAENQDALMKDPLFKTVVESLFLKSEIQDLNKNS
ncbi:helix-turn-helix domain containing protein [Cellulophaga phage phi46:1]|uniref:helix-turn-helix domain containing protein n=1 Tax=Cellulophaga phage phi46:1 TaxID=1327974 RepID=UPI0003517E68|nr:helix-turn-helix domain containing protein [Cellulophaga phage phi46:1]AGO47836.1 helix-turn-helix domain containing protein [Cellulophaga phage phi46:1]